MREISRRATLKCGLGAATVYSTGFLGSTTLASTASDLLHQASAFYRQSSVLNLTEATIYGDELSVSSLSRPAASLSNKPFLVSPKDGVVLQDLYCPSSISCVMKNHAESLAIRIKTFVEENSDTTIQVLSVSDIDKALRMEKHAIVMGVRGTDHFKSLDDVDAFHAMGQRVCKITRNNDRRLGRANASLIHRMNEAGICIDVSLVDDRAARDIAENTARPIIISSSAVSSRGKLDCVLPRSLEAMLAVASSGGIIAVEAIPMSRRDMTNTVDHIDRLSNQIGVDHVALGAGFSAADYIAIAGLLLARGYSDGNIERILGDNNKRTLAKVWT